MQSSTHSAQDAQVQVSERLCGATKLIKVSHAVVALHQSVHTSGMHAARKRPVHYLEPSVPDKTIFTKMGLTKY